MFHRRHSTTAWLIFELVRVQLLQRLNAGCQLIRFCRKQGTLHNRLNNCSQEPLRLQRQPMLRDDLYHRSCPANVVPHSLQLQIRLRPNPPFILYQCEPCALCANTLLASLRRSILTYGKISRLCLPSRFYILQYALGVTQV